MLSTQGIFPIMLTFRTKSNLNLFIFNAPSLKGNTTISEKTIGGTSCLGSEKQNGKHKSPIIRKDSLLSKPQVFMSESLNRFDKSE